MEQLTFQDILKQLLEAILPVLGLLISFAAWRLSQWIAAKKAEVKAAVGEKNFYLLTKQAELAVQAAEQLGLSGQIEDEAEEKFKMAKAWLQTKADALGIAVDVDDLQMFIESAIRRGVHKDITLTLGAPANEPSQES